MVRLALGADGCASPALNLYRYRGECVLGQPAQEEQPFIHKIFLLLGQTKPRE
jgi:hypothetical protein